MKVRELFTEGDVVDFAQRAKLANDVRFRKKREKDENDAYEWFEGEGELEQQTTQELNDFDAWMKTAKKKARVPGFEDLNEVVYFLSVDTNIPAAINRQSAVNWFSHLNEIDRDRVVMISHHVDRLIRVYEMLRNKLQGLQNIWYQRFKGKIPKDWDTIAGSDWLLIEFKDDIKILQSCKQLVNLLGQ